MMVGDNINFNLTQLLSLLMFTLFVQGIEAKDFNCEYSIYNLYRYTCSVTVDIKNDYATIIGKHLYGKSDSDLNNLVFHNSNVDKIPVEIFSKFSNIKILDAQSSHLRVFDRSSLKGARNLEELHLYGNSIKRLEADTFSEAGNLKYIGLQRNLISTVDETSFRSLWRLESLYLGFNYIVTLEIDVFRDLINLKVLDLHSNMIEELPKGLFKNNSKLQIVNLNYNKIKSIASDLFKYLENLMTVNLSFNTCISKYFAKGQLPLSSLNDESNKCPQPNTFQLGSQELNKNVENLKQEIANLRTKNSHQTSEILSIKNDLLDAKNLGLLKSSIINDLQLEIISLKRVNQECLRKQIDLQEALKTSTEICSKQIANVSSHVNGNVMNAVDFTTSHSTYSICVNVQGEQEAEAAMKVIAERQSLTNRQKFRKFKS